MTASITRTEPRPDADPTDAPPAPPAPERAVPRRRPGMAEACVVMFLCLGALAIHWGQFDRELTERHDWRQTQTALTAVDFHEHGIDLLHPKLPVFGPRSEAPFEFPLFQAVATVPMNLGIDADASMRGTGFACFLLTALLLYGLVRRVGGRVAATGALVAFLFSPFAVQWSHSSLIEYFVTAAAVGFVWAGIEWREHRRGILLAVAIVLGSVAMAVKVTTGIVWIVPLVLYTGAHEMKGVVPWIKERLRPGLIAAVVVPVLAGAWWTRHADAIKDASLATRWLTSGNGNAHNFGTLDQRFVLDNWLTVFDRIDLLLVGRGLLVVLAVAALWWGRKQRFWLGMLLVVALGPAVFFNLYVVHDYYLAAISPALAALVGLAVSWVWTRWPAALSRTVLAAVLVAGWLFWVFAPAWSYVEPVYEQPWNDFTVAAKEMQEATPEGAPVVYLGAEWNPTMVYYSGHSGLMLDPAIVDEPGILTRLPDQPYRYVFSFQPDDDPIHVLSTWRWVGVLGPRTYVVGAHRSDVDHAPVYASTAPSSSDVASTNVRCDDADRTPKGERDPSLIVREPRLRVRDDLAPLPPVGTLYVEGGAELSCTGARSIEVSVDSE